MSRFLFLVSNMFSTKSQCSVIKTCHWMKNMFEIFVRKEEKCKGFVAIGTKCVHILNRRGKHISTHVYIYIYT